MEEPYLRETEMEPKKYYSLDELKRFRDELEYYWTENVIEELTPAAQEGAMMLRARQLGLENEELARAIIAVVPQLAYDRNRS
jgi:hypothetical protein